MNARALLVVLLLTLAACSRAPRCDLAAQRDLSFTGAEAQETVEVRVIGADCDKAIGVFSVLDADRRPLWSWSAPLERAYGDVFPPRDVEAMTSFLDRWAQPTVERTAQAPDWALLAPGQTGLDRVTYEDLRARDLPMLCHYSGSARQTCVFWEPVVGLAGHFYDRDAPDEPTQAEPEAETGPEEGRFD